MKDITIQSLDAALRGVFEAEVEGQMRRVLVPGAAPGDRLDVELVAVSQHHPRAHGQITAVHRRGDQFVAPPCPHAAPLRGRCGGCPAMHLSQSLRDRAKFEAATETLEPLGAQMSWHAAPQQQGYRNRSNFVVRRRDERVVLGSFAPRSNEVASMTGCLVVRPAVEVVHRRLEELLTAENVPVHREEGALRWVSIREAAGQVVVELIVRDDRASWIGAVVGKIARFDEVSGVGVSVNDEKTNAIRRGPTVIVEGQGTLVERYGLVDLQIPPGAFAQLNVAVASRMYEQARVWAGDAKVVWDLYCGIGGLGLNAVVGREGAKLWGLEEVASAVDAARGNAEDAGIEAQFEVVDLGDPITLTALQAPRGLTDPQAVMVNPPRKGMSTPLRNWLAENPMGAERVVYMSCDPGSFGRDARALIDGGWQLREIEVHDMLPMTRHVEVLGIFSWDDP